MTAQHAQLARISFPIPCAFCSAAIFSESSKVTLPPVLYFLQPELEPTFEIRVAAALSRISSCRRADLELALRNIDRYSDTYRVQNDSGSLQPSAKTRRVSTEIRRANVHAEPIRTGTSVPPVERHIVYPVVWVRFLRRLAVRRFGNRLHSRHGPREDA